MQAENQLYNQHRIMKKTLILFAFLLPCAGVFAQEYVGTVRISRPVGVGTIREEQAIDHLTAANLVDRGATARYSAGQSVTLQPGFVAQAGSVFQATISAADGRRSPEPGPGTTLTAKAFPNPFETATTIEYNLPAALPVIHTLRDATGQLIRRFNAQQIESAGIHRTPLDLSHLPTGVYLYQVETQTGSKALRLVKK